MIRKLRAKIIRKWWILIARRHKYSGILSKHVPIEVVKNIGFGCVINEDTKIMKNDVNIGDYTYINGGYIFYADIGKYCSIGYNVNIGPGEHYTDKVSTFPLRYKVANYDGLIDFPIQEKSVIENDVWIGNNSTILQGVRVGCGAVVASGSVVTKDVMPYSIVAGIPAKHIKYRVSERHIDPLLKIRWWDWPSDKIKKSVINHEFDDISIFIEKHS